MKKALTAFAAAAVFAALTAPAFAQLKPPGQKSEAATLGDTNLNRKSEWGTATTMGTDTDAAKKKRKSATKADDAATPAPK